MLMLIFLVDGVAQMQRTLIMFYQELDLSFVMPTVHWYSAANFKRKLHCQPRRRNILQCLMLCVRQSWFRTLSRKSIAFLICQIRLQIFCITCHEDNLSAIATAESLKFTPRTNHIAIKYHHFWSRVQTSFNKLGDIKIKYILMKLQLADIFTKPLENDSFFRCCNMPCGWWLILILLCSKGVWEYMQWKKVFNLGFQTRRINISLSSQFTQNKKSHSSFKACILTPTHSRGTLTVQSHWH